MSTREQMLLRELWGRWLKNDLDSVDFMTELQLLIPGLLAAVTGNQGNWHPENISTSLAPAPQPAKGILAHAFESAEWQIPLERLQQIKRAIFDYYPLGEEEIEMVLLAAGADSVKPITPEMVRQADALSEGAEEMAARLNAAQRGEK